ncbi:MAG: HYR domain-containing protein [Acidobacteriota bacterium]
MRLTAPEKDSSAHSTSFKNSSTVISKLIALRAINRARCVALLTLVAIMAAVSYATISAPTRGGLWGSGGSNSAPASKPGNKAVAASTKKVARAQDLGGQAASDPILGLADLNIERRGHTATQLADGKILIIGGENEEGLVRKSEAFDPDSRSFLVAARLKTARKDHTATKLVDGRVLVGGGRNQTPIASTEIFDPAKGVFDPGPSLNRARAGHSATMLRDGRLLIVGGDDQGTAEIFDPERQTFTLLEARLSASRAFHSAVLLRNGKGLIAGGLAEDKSALQYGEIFDPETMSFSVTGNSMRGVRVRPTLRVLPDGKVQVIGGDDERSMEMFNAEGEYFTAYAHLLPGSNPISQILRAQTRAGLIHEVPPGEVKLQAALPASLDELLDRSEHTLTDMPKAGEAVVAGGKSGAGKVLKSVVILSSSGATVTTDKTDYVPGETAIITGSGWFVGETVKLTLHRDNGTDDTILTAVADADGNFTNSEYVIQDSDLGVTFLLTAVGQTSGFTAQTTFTDASPGSLGNYATAGLSGSTAPANVSPSNVAANVTFSNLTRGSGLTAVAAADAFNSSNWPTTSTLTIAGNTDYYEFTITPNSCHAFSASELRVGLQRSGTGPSQMELRSSLDSFGSTIGSVLNVAASLATFTVNLSPVSGLQNRASPVTFRLYGYNASQAAGTLRIQRVTSPVMVGLEVDGTVATADNTPPVVSGCPSNQTLYTGPGATTCTATTSWAAPSAPDNCDGTLSVTCVPPSGSSFSKGTTTVTCSATDTSTNTGSCSFTVTVVDNTPPVVSGCPSNQTLYTGPGATTCTATTSWAAPSAPDNCDGTLSVTCVPPSGSSFSKGTTTVTCSATDTSTNTGSCSFMVTVVDNTKPVMTCPTVPTAYTAPGACSTAVSFTPTATDNCAVDSVTCTPPSGSVFSVGTTSVSCYATDTSGNNSLSCDFSVTVKGTTISTVMVSPDSQQYSDKVTFMATLSPVACSGVGAPATSVSFYVGTQLMGTALLVVDGAVLKGTLADVALLEPVPFGTAPTGQMAPTAPGTRTVTAVFGGVNPNFMVTNPTTTLNIIQEDARAYYTGALYASTACAICSTATVTLSATIKDITAVDSASDNCPGDIRNAKVTFINRDTNTVIQANQPVGLVSAGDTTVGTATYNWNVSIGSANSQTYTVGVIVTNYYTRDSSDEDTVVTVSKPLNNFITGGGYLVMSSSSGLYPGEQGSKCNWGFNVKYNNSGKNLQGNINVIIRNGGRVYQIKGNAMTSLSTNVATGKATFNGKANIQDITDPLNVIGIDGNATLQVVMTDKGEPGNLDTIGITVWNKQGGLWFSSNWNGTTTIEQLLGGGNLVVH